MEIQAPQQLVAKQCKPCEGGVNPCTLDVASAQVKQLDAFDDTVSSGGKRMTSIKHIPRRVQLRRQPR